MLLAFLKTHWFDVLQTLSILFGFYVAITSIRENTSAQKVRNLFELNRSYQNIWNHLISQPELRRIFDVQNTANIEVTYQEEFLVKQLISHLNVTFKAISLGQLSQPQGMEQNIKEFFALPIPRAVWEKVKAYQDDDLVAYIDKEQS